MQAETLSEEKESNRPRAGAIGAVKVFDAGRVEFGSKLVTLAKKKPTEVGLEYWAS